jgi:hypothetical protein
MQQPRKTLSIKVSPTDIPNVAPEDPAAILAQGIQVKLCVTATYNKADFVMAPHILYTKHDEMFIDAMVVERDGNPPREAKLGTFKLSGLSGIALTGRRFEPFPGFDPADAKYADTALKALKG